MKNKGKKSGVKKSGLEKFIVCVIILYCVSYAGFKDYLNNGLKDQKTGEALTELGLMNYRNSAVTWAGIYQYFNKEPVKDLLYKTRDCRNIKCRGEFYPDHNKYDFMQDTGLACIIGDLWKPNQTEIKYLLNNYTATKFKGVTVWRKNKDGN